MSQTVKCFPKVIIGVSQSINKFDKEGKILFLLVRLAYRNFAALVILNFYTFFLQEVLEEIRDEREKEALPAGESVVESEQEDSGIVLVACKDERSCMQLEDFITHGAQKVFLTLYLV